MLSCCIVMHCGAGGLVSLKNCRLLRRGGGSCIRIPLRFRTCWRGVCILVVELCQRALRSWVLYVLLRLVDVLSCLVGSLDVDLVVVGVRTVVVGSGTGVFVAFVRWLWTHCRG